MKPRTVVIGLGLFGREVALSLSRRGVPVLAVDRDAALVEGIKNSVAGAMVLDTTDETALREAGIGDMQVAVCAIGTQHVENSILTTALLRQLGVPRILVRAANDLHARILRQVGATEVINPEREMGRRLANRIAKPGIREVLNVAPGVSLAEVPIPPGFAGKTLAGLDVRRKYGVNVIGVRRRVPAGAAAEETRETTRPGAALEGNRRFILNVSPTEELRDDDILVVIGADDDIRRFSGIG